eukprot:scaffold113535_cov24-Tisochrysis_lutea.AAC.4
MAPESHCAAAAASAAPNSPSPSPEWRNEGSSATTGASLSSITTGGTSPPSGAASRATTATAAVAAASDCTIGASSGSLPVGSEAADTCCSGSAGGSAGRISSSCCGDVRPLSSPRPSSSTGPPALPAAAAVREAIASPSNCFTLRSASRLSFFSAASFSPVSKRARCAAFKSSTAAAAAASAVAARAVAAASSERVLSSCASICTAEQEARVISGFCAQSCAQVVVGPRAPRRSCELCPNSPPRRAHLRELR